jgi:hypothetical protein
VPDVDETTLLPVRAGGFTCWCDSLRSYGGELVLMSLYGPRNAVRAAWAKLNSAERRNPTIQIGDEEHGRAHGVLYATINTPMADGADLHTILIDRRATRGGEDPAFYFQVGPDPHTRFFPRLAERCPLPLRAAWSADLWELGQSWAGDAEDVERMGGDEGYRRSQLAPISRLGGHGLPVYRVETGATAWGPIVKASLLEGRLS